MWEESAGSDERVFGRPSAGVDVPLKDNVFLTHFPLEKQKKNPILRHMLRSVLTVNGFTDIGRGTAGWGSDPGKEAKPATRTKDHL